MILKDIFLYPDLIEFSRRKEDLLMVRDQTRHIGNYLGRRLADLKFQADGFNRICVVGQTKPRSTYISSTATLLVHIPFDMDECRSVPRDELSNYYATLLETGVEKCASEYRIPVDELLSWLQEMKQDGYRNEWTFKDKLFRCRLTCAMDLDKLTLRLTVFNKDTQVLDKIILTTPPDEIAFHYKFKDVVIEGEHIVVTTRLHGESEKVLFRTLIPSLH
jgi:hypothetical protein